VGEIERRKLATGDAGAESSRGHKVQEFVVAQQVADDLQTTAALLGLRASGTRTKDRNAFQSLRRALDRLVPHHSCSSLCFQQQEKTLQTEQAEVGERVGKQLDSVKHRRRAKRSARLSWNSRSTT
jgi:hypothetical protein